MDASGKVVRTVAGKYEGNRFNAPNDLVIDAAGGTYFTDPHFRRSPAPRRDGRVLRRRRRQGHAIDRRPQSPQRRDSLARRTNALRHPEHASRDDGLPRALAGKLGKGRVFCTLRQPAGASGKGGDGLTVDVKGNLYITSALGLQVYSPAGELLGIIKLPEQPANCTFGGAGCARRSTSRPALRSIPCRWKSPAMRSLKGSSRSRVVA